MSSSTLTAPEDLYRWFLSKDGNELGLIQRYDTDTDEYASPDQSVEDGITMEYLAVPDEIIDLADEPEIDKSLHWGLVCFIRMQLSLDGSTELDMVNSQKWERAYIKEIKNHAKDSKYSGTKRILAPSLV